MACRRRSTTSNLKSPGLLLPLFLQLIVASIQPWVKAVILQPGHVRSKVNDLGAF